MARAKTSLAEAAVSANVAGLRYVTDRMPGISRIGSRKSFRYVAPNGRVIRDAETLKRIRSLVVPPAWRQVWICAAPDGHLQAVGRDSRKRKQYRYHPRWRQVRDGVKFHRMIAFGKALPRIRDRVRRDLARPGLSREKVLATVVRLLETTFIRVGNEEYTRQNLSYGLTTLRDRHVDVAGAKINFYFRGKSGIRHALTIEDAHLAKIVRRLRDLPGYELFQYFAESGERKSVGSSDVNEYLRAISGEDFTAKDFRTWAGAVLAVRALSEQLEFRSQKQARKNILNAVASVAERLGNTAAVCRKCYIHPAVFEAYLERSPALILMRAQSAGLRPEERAVLTLLQKQSKLQSAPTLEQSLRRSIRFARRTRPTGA